MSTTGRHALGALLAAACALGCSLTSGGIEGGDDTGLDGDRDTDGTVGPDADADADADGLDGPPDDFAEDDTLVDVADDGGGGDVDGDEDGAVDVADDGAGSDGDADDVADDDGAETEVGVCDPSGLDDHCASDIIQRCRPDGMGWDVVPCPFGCTGYGLGARCFELVPSNVTDAALLTASVASFAPSGVRLLLFETGTGAIRAWNAAGAELAALRAAGAGDVGGIVFTVQPQAAGMPELAIWSFADFSLPAGVDVVGVGPRAMVLMVAGDVRISGAIHVGGSVAFLLGSVWVGHDSPGPGGSAGGGAGGWGVGAGAGEGGGERDWPYEYNDSGGGGAGCGAAGGPGGSISGISSGRGGVSYGEPTLMPLLGGSGGGGGGDGQGGRGGHGAGALQIVSATGIWVAAGGGIGAGGGFGAGGRANGSSGGAGGGGGSGGSILLEAPRVDIAGVVAANGAGGGAGARNADTWGNNGQNGQVSGAAAAGGGGGDAGTAGGNGSSATSAGGSAGEGSDSRDDSGGGGGGAGRIRLNALVHSIGGTVSPAESTSLTTRGTLVLL